MELDPQDVPSDGVEEPIFQAWSRDDSVAGTAGKVNYSIPDCTIFKMTWNIPHAKGTANQFTCKPEGHLADSYTIVISNIDDLDGGAYKRFEPIFKIKHK